MAVLRDIASLSLSNLQEIAADASKANGLSGGGALVGCRHFSEIVVIYPKQKSASDKNRGQGTHDLIVFPSAAARKNVIPVRAEECTGWACPVICLKEAAFE
jgi:hypothetical protein